MERQRKNSKLFYAARGAVAFTWFFVIFKLTSIILFIEASAITSREVSLFTGLPEYVVFLTASVAAVFIFNSVSLMFSTFDKDEIDNFLERKVDFVSLKEEIKILFTTPHVVSELITMMLLVAVTALIGGFAEIGSIFFDGTHHGGWFPTVIITPVCFVLFLSSKYEARRYWFYLNRIGEMERVTSPVKFYKRFALIFFLYPLTFPYSPLLVFIAYSFFSILVSLFGALTVIGFIMLAVSAFLFMLVIPTLKRHTKRKKFIRTANEIAAREGYTVKWRTDSEIKEKNISKFDLTLNGKEFNCLVIGTGRKRVPLIFTSATNAYFEHRFGTQEHHISIKRQIDFFLHGEGTKVIIVNPSPKHVYVTDGIKMKRLSSSDRIWSCTVHDDVSFLGAMERKCLDRYSTLNE